MATTVTLGRAFGAGDRTPHRTLDLSRTVHPADWAQLPESLRARFAVRHEPMRFAAAMRFERSAIGAVFALLATPFKAPLPLHRRVDLPVVVDVRAVGKDIVWLRRFGASSLVRSVKSAGAAGTVIGPALVFTSKAFFLSVGRCRLPIPAWLTPGRCRSNTAPSTPSGSASPSP